MNLRGISIEFERATSMSSEADGKRKKRQLQIALELLGMELFVEVRGGMEGKG